ncbi:uncharacterized protein P174DRAFT_374918 [Aspergillus novofumigatus IBT 16806]|uniref:Uncharacterized protein n=1 Tax=Aspergillus novofumigatus (strain IBT 16806) TaxID=1392255 RepID=A0A2I1C1C6_ASPN1|nr:uncharacterized protein P174DRAFT_374918 [Aspergillus novofumigatus IBT 16806]PKX91405.1 hypothetical protein P174DRAFT_374918 [Aspergillus novofumigatus IBT 16806]
MACTQVVSVLLSWIGAAIGRQSQASPARSQRAQPSSATQYEGHIVAAQVPAYMSPPAMKVSDKEYDQDQTDTMHETQITDSRQEVVSGDTEESPSTTSSIIDLDGLIDESPRPPRDSFQVWIAHSTKIMQPELRENSSKEDSSDWLIIPRKP